MLCLTAIHGGVDLIICLIFCRKHHFLTLHKEPTFFFPVPRSRSLFSPAPKVSSCTYSYRLLLLVGCDPLVVQFWVRRNRIREWALSTPLAKLTVEMWLYLK
jgi:hypothetical protein